MKIRFCFQLTLLLVGTIVTAEWLTKTKKTIAMNNVIARFKELSITTCYLKCNLTKRCSSFGMEKNGMIGEVNECFLLSNDTQAMKGDAMGATMALYVTDIVSCTTYYRFVFPFAYGSFSPSINLSLFIRILFLIISGLNMTAL